MTAELVRREAVTGSQVADDGQKARILDAIRRQSNACGCEAASLFMLGALLSFLAYVMFGDVAWTAGEALRRGGAWVLSATLVGKLAGLGYARARLLMLRSTLRREFGNRL